MVTTTHINNILLCRVDIVSLSIKSISVFENVTLEYKNVLKNNLVFCII